MIGNEMTLHSEEILLLSSRQHSHFVFVVCVNLLGEKIKTNKYPQTPAFGYMVRDLWATSLVYPSRP